MIKDYHNKHIIFDLGNVILPIDFSAPVKAFAEIGLEDFDALYGKIQQSDFFNLLETGKITEQYFRDEMRRISGISWTDKQIDDACSTIILDFRKATFYMLEKLAVKESVYLLSNTNSIHFKRYNQQVVDKFCKGGLSSYFKKAYYSHELGVRKPGEEIFQYVLNDLSVNAEECLFIDDHPDNIATANRMGFHTYLLSSDERVEESFNVL